MKMEEMVTEAVNQDLEKRKMERERSDLVSKKLGELLLQGFRMLNETCENCDCILMQKKTEPKVCVGCEEDKRNNKINNNQFSDAPKQLPSKTTPIFSSALTNNPNQIQRTHNFDKIEVLQSKINWATGELASPTNISNIKYTIELCEVIKVASEAILALQKIQ